jgi:exopolyphosphatase/pppGpp-phosphohydrolase
VIPLLHIGEERTSIADGALALGWRSIARDHFRHDPPSPLEIENAIAAVEDELERPHKAVAKGGVLRTRDPAMRAIALAAGVAQGAETTLALEAVEQMFTRLAAGARGLPAGGEFSATLLILRELMHHLNFSSVLIDA